MTKQTNAEEAKRLSRGWSDAMDSESMGKRLAKLEELSACWKTLAKNKKISEVSSVLASESDNLG